MEFYILLCVCTAVWSTASAARRPYIAAALEHARFGGLLDSPSRIVQENLKRYRKAAEVAASKGADIIVYPEYGTFPSGNRRSVKKYLEDVPDPTTSRINPCEDEETYSDRPILLNLSCISKEHNIFLVANMGDIKKCSSEDDPDCPDDGAFHFNTNVVFDRNGTLLVRYHKEHLFFEFGMDVGRKRQDTTFQTDFGTFATFVCFDLLFEWMSEVAQQVDGIIFSTMWVEVMPQYSTVPLWQGWGIGNNRTIVASSLQKPSLYALGSGIFDAQSGSLGYTYDPDGISKLVVAEVPLSGQPNLSKASVTAIEGDATREWTEDGEKVPKSCSRNILKDILKIENCLLCAEENTKNYTLVKLKIPSGYVEACNNGMCCSLNYSADDMKEDFYLGVSNNTFNFLERYFWCEESCFIARCDSKGLKKCSKFPRRADTLFNFVEMRANFSTPFVYPSVVGSRSRLVPMTEWQFSLSPALEGLIHFEKTSGEKLINAGFKARCYDRDPPYVE